MRLLLSFIVVLTVIGLSSCRINQNFMFKEPEDYTFNKPNIDSTNKEYRVGPNDYISMDIYTNGGALLIQYTTSGIDFIRNQAGPEVTYLVDKDGFVQLPALGRMKVGGMTITDIQNLLENSYAFQFNDPYCVVKVINKRVIVFPGNGGSAVVVPLENENIHLLEAIALAGGLQERAISSKIKVFRKVSGKQEVYLVDLSTIEGIQYSNFAMQSGDIVFVDSAPRKAQEVLKVAQPYLTLVGFIFLFSRAFTF
jgi:polysaccharide biosynthesis/export protein